MGRPSRDQAAQLRDHILDAATELFFADGFGATSIEAVARRAGISKRTFYHRFADKADLFAAVLHRIVEGLRPPATVPLVAGADPAHSLRHLGTLILHAALTPEALSMHRLIVGESGRFPKLAAAVAAEGASVEAVTLIASLLVREPGGGEDGPGDPAFAAEQFLHMIVGIPQRRALGLGQPMAPADLERWVDKVVALFLDGWRSPTPLPR